MAVTSVQHPGAGGTTDFDLTLKIFSGEVMAEFDKRTVLMALHRVKDLAPGAESVQFPALGTLDTKYHVPGENILADGTYLENAAQGERLIFADREALCPIFQDKIEERIMHADMRKEYAHQAGQSLARNVDQMCFRTLARGARTAEDGAATYSGGPTGESIVNTLADGGAIVTALLQAEQKLDEKDVPLEDRFAVLEPVTYQKLINSDEGKEYINSDFQPVMVNGQLSHSRIDTIANFRLIKTTNMPHDNYTGTGNRLVAASKGNDYRTNTTNSLMFCFQRQAFGTAKAVGIRTEMEYKIEYRGTVLVASYAMGHATLRPECIIEYKSA